MKKSNRSWRAYFRRVRLWHKKRGARTTGSRFLGGAGEATFYACLFSVGAIAFGQMIYDVARGKPIFSNTATFWLWVLVIASLIVTGIGGFIFSISRVATSDERRLALAKRAKNIELLPQSAPKGLPTVPSAANLTNSPGVTLKYRLPVSERSIWRVPFAATFCVLWNAMFCWMAAVLVHQSRTNDVEWMLAALALPVSVVGVASIYQLAKQVMMATALGPTGLEISDHPLRPGDNYQVQLSQTGNTHMKLLEVLLVCEEEATYAQGTDTRLERRRVFEKGILREENFDIRAGSTFDRQCELQLPLDAMHSFQAEHNAILWRIVVRGAAKRWRAFNREFPIVVYPLELCKNVSEPKLNSSANKSTDNLSLPSATEPT